MASQPFTSSKQSLLPHSHMALQRGCRPISAVAQEDTAAQAAAARARLAAERELARQRGVAFSRVGWRWHHNAFSWNFGRPAVRS